MSIMGEEFNTALFVGAALDRDERRHHRPGLRRSASARHPRGTDRARGRRRRRRHGPRRAHRRRSARHRGIGVAAVGRSGSSPWPCCSSSWAAWSGCASPRRCSPPSTGSRGHRARSSRIAFAFTLAFAELADLAQLAPIVGAFVAGIALSKADQSERIRRDLTPVGHLFIPVFFLQIGIDADVTSFGSGEVLRDASILLVVAVVGKLLSPLGAIGAPGDKPLIGLGMLPRGEVGLDLRDHRPAERGARRRPLRRAPPGRARHDAGHAAAAEGPVPPPPGRREARRHAERHPATRGRVAPGRRRRRGVGGAPARRAVRPARARGRDLPRAPATSPRAPRLAHGRRARDERVERRSSPPRSSMSSSAGTSARGGSSRPPVCSTPRSQSWPAPSIDGPATPSPSTALALTGCRRCGVCACSTRTTRCRSRCGRWSTWTGCCSPRSSSRPSRTNPTSTARPT